MINRLFTFGCSFTNYHWPTWADILLSEIPGENWALSGGGNKFIFERLMECHITNQIKPNDCVIIMWTSFTREDRYVDGWRLTGNVYNSQPYYDQNFLNKYWSDKGCVLHNLNFISAAIEVLKSINCKWLMCYAFPSNQFNDYSKMLVQSVQDIEHFQKYFSFIYEHDNNFISDPLFNETNSVSKWSEAAWGKNVIENHYFPIQHHCWLENNLLDKLHMDQPARDRLLTFSVKHQKECEQLESIGKHPSLFDKHYAVNYPKNQI